MVLELKMPDMSGVEVMREVDLSYPETQIVILTEERSLESAVTALRSGVVDYLLKPYATQDFLRGVGRALIEITGNVWYIHDIVAPPVHVRAAGNEK